MEGKSKQAGYVERAGITLILEKREGINRCHPKKKAHH